MGISVLGISVLDFSEMQLTRLRTTSFVQAEGLSSVGPNCDVLWDDNLAGPLYL